MHAYVDESEPSGDRDHTVYVLAAVIVAAAERERVGEAVRLATPERERKLHWYGALRAQRLTWLDLLRRAVQIIVVRYEGAAARAERRRRYCLERLVWELEQRDVRLVVLESRGRAADDRDRSMFDALRRRGTGRDMRHEHVSGNAEPLVALPDIACGAHVAGLDSDLDPTVIRVS